MIVSDNTTEAESLTEFFKTHGKKDLMHQKHGKKCLKKTAPALEMGTNVGTAFAS